MCRARVSRIGMYVVSSMVYAVCVSSPLRHFFFLPPLASFLAPAAAGSSSGPCHGHRKSTKRRSLCTCQPRSTALVIRHGEARHGRGGGAAAYQLVRGECGGVAHHQPLEEERLVLRRQLEQRRVRLVHQAHHACRHAGAQARRGSEASRRRLLLPQALQCTAGYTTRRAAGSP